MTKKDSRVLGKGFLTPKDVAEILKISPRTVLRMIKKATGMKLRAIMFSGNYRVRVEDLEEYLEKRKI